MTLPYPTSPDKDENVATSITRIEQNLEYLDSALSSQDVKVVYKSYTMSTTSGNISVSGVGFQPSAFIMYAFESTGDSTSFGSCDSTSNFHCVFRTYANAVGYQAKSSYNFVAVGESIASELVSFDSDGATLDWTTTVTAGTLYIIFVFFA